MKKLSEYKDEEALDLLADILEPVALIMSDNTVKEAFDAGNRLKMISAIIKTHKAEIMQILAAMEGVPESEYHCDILTLPARVLEVLNDDAFMQVFTSRVKEMTSVTSSTPAMESTKADEQ